MSFPVNKVSGESPRKLRFCLLKAQPPRLPGVLPLQETFPKSPWGERKDQTASLLKSCSERDAHSVTGLKSRVLEESHSVNTPRIAGSMETFWATSHRLGRHRRELHRKDLWRALPRASLSTRPSAAAGGRERSTRPQRPRPRPALYPWAGTEPANQKFLKHANTPPSPGERRFPTLAASFADAATVLSSSHHSAQVCLLGRKWRPERPAGGAGSALARRILAGSRAPDTPTCRWRRRYTSDSFAL